MQAELLQVTFYGTTLLSVLSAAVSLNAIALQVGEELGSRWRDDLRRLQHDARQRSVPLHG